jgi:hypothetical protein
MWISLFIKVLRSPHYGDNFSKNTEFLLNFTFSQSTRPFGPDSSPEFPAHSYRLIKTWKENKLKPTQKGSY